MENKIDLLLNLLNKVKDSNDLKELETLEEKLQSLSPVLEKYIDENQHELEKSNFLKKLQSVKEVINGLEKKNNFNNKIFKEFKEFIVSRKFK